MSGAAITGAILAGGRSARMGTNKALLAFGGRPIIQSVIETLRPIFREVAIVASDGEPYAGFGLPIWPDRIPDAGPLGGIYTAVYHSAFPHAFCIACDMPFADPAVIAHLADRAVGYDVVIPRTPDGPQPLYAVYGKDCLPHMEAMIQADRLRIDGLFPAVRVRTIDAEELRRLDPSLRCFINVNTPEALTAALRLARLEGIERSCGS